MSAELDRLIGIFIDRLVNRSCPYYKQWANGQGYEPVYESLSSAVVLEHIQGFITISLPPFDALGNCNWCVWDNDCENGNLARIEDVLRTLGLHPLREAKRPGREGHLWLIFDAKVPAVALRRFDRYIRQITELKDDHNLEFFPKQNKQASEETCPNGVRMPLGINRKPEARGAVGWFEDCPNRDRRAQLAWFPEQPLNPAQGIINLAARLKKQDDREFKVIRYSSSQTPSAVEVFDDLNPKMNGDYYVCDCPRCDQRTAYFYEDGFMLHCNRVNNCGFKISAAEYSRQR